MATVWRLAAATTLIVTAFAITGPVVAVLMQRAGHGTAAVGATAMLQFLAVFLLMPVMPRLIGRFGVVRTYRVGVLIELCGACGYAAGNGVAAWAMAALVSGAGAAALWNATESLLAREAPPERRGRVMGLYQTALGGALAVGPFLPGLLGAQGRTLLWLAAALVLACCAIAFLTPLHAVHETASDAAHGGAGTWAAVRQAPALVALACAGGVFEAGLNAVSAANASALGLSLGGAASVAGAIGVGSFLCQYPAGYAADHAAPRRVFTVATVLLLAACVAFAFAARWPWLLWPVGAVWGGVGGALYTLTMIRVAHEFQAGASAGTAAMITGYTAGGALGPPAAGAALQAAGAPGLALALGLVAVAALWAARRMPA